jgi:hypothetical protein
VIEHVFFFGTFFSEAPANSRRILQGIINVPRPFCKMAVIFSDLNRNSVITVYFNKILTVKL